MSDEKTSLDFVAGRLQGTLEHLSRQDRQHELDKQQAIQARDARHQETQDRFKAMEAKLDTAALDHDWIETVGKPMNGRVAKLKHDGATVHGKIAGIALICTAIGGAAAALGKNGIAAIVKFLG